MMKNYITKFAILLTGLVLSQTTFADVKVKIRQTISGQSFVRFAGSSARSARAA